MVLSRGAQIGIEGMEKLIGYMLGKGNAMYEGVKVSVFKSEPVGDTGNYQRMNSVRAEVLGKRMNGYLQETGRDPVNLELALVDEAGTGYRLGHSMSFEAYALNKITNPPKK